MFCTLCLISLCVSRFCCTSTQRGISDLLPAPLQKLTNPKNHEVVVASNSSPPQLDMDAADGPDTRRQGDRAAAFPGGREGAPSHADPPAGERGADLQGGGFHLRDRR
ncbi:hypothetical protein DPMN_126384 [Dreissena polymorpha]|uniref:Secreted protein n=1 Tax=Dreissena polymorpha TaxID=45954 RepID=A0A9D4GX78_DREPO|nr:hypothetical protein DPMN_126384 [Dreissena polymorpha]